MTVPPSLKRCIENARRRVEVREDGLRKMMSQAAEASPLTIGSSAEQISYETGRLMVNKAMLEGLELAARIIEEEK